MKAYPLLLLVFCIISTGCDWINVSSGSDDFHRNYAAKYSKAAYDKYIIEEKNKEPAQGYRTKPYSPEQYVHLWNRIFTAILTTDLPESYKGPTNLEWIEYIIEERRNAGLPELELTAEVIDMIDRDRTPHH